MEKTQGVHSIFLNQKEIAKIDNTDNNRIIVILIDKEEPYKQVFFVKNKFEQLVNDTKKMRELGISSF